MTQKLSKTELDKQGIYWLVNGKDWAQPDPGRQNTSWEQSLPLVFLDVSFSPKQRKHIWHGVKGLQPQFTPFLISCSSYRNFSFPVLAKVLGWVSLNGFQLSTHSWAKSCNKICWLARPGVMVQPLGQGQGLPSSIRTQRLVIPRRKESLLSR